jgi:hypothetical protein
MDDAPVQGMDDKELRKRNDAKIQINTIATQAISELEKKFPGSSFDLLVRDFAPTIHITLRKAQLSEMMKNIPEDFVFEDFGLDTASAQGTLLYRNGQRMNYERTICFLRELRNIPILEELKSHVRYEEFVPWLHNPCQQQHFFSELQERHPTLFTHLDYETTISELTNVLMAAIERKYRSDDINWYIGNLKGVEAKLTGLYDWQMRRSEWWFNHVREFLPEFAPCGFQRVTVGEIVPNGLENYFGPIGGKTIKIGSFNKINEEFILSQRDAFGTKAADMTHSRLQEVRDLFMHVLVARRYIFPEAIDMIIDYDARVSGEDVSGFRNDPHFRSHTYRVFSNNSRRDLDKIYGIYNLLPEKD